MRIGIASLSGVCFKELANLEAQNLHKVLAGSAHWPGIAGKLSAKVLQPTSTPPDPICHHP